MPLIPCYGCKQEVSDSVEKCPKCGFFYPLGDSISNCIECHKEIHTESKTCYNCDIEDPLGIEKRRREKHPIFFLFEVPIFFIGGFLISFILSNYVEPDGDITDYLALGLFCSGILLKIFSPSYSTSNICYGCKQEISLFVMSCPKCGFFLPIGDSIGHCHECGKEIHTKSKTCYNCGTEDPLGMKKRRRKEYPIYSRLEMPIIYLTGFLTTFISAHYFGPYIFNTIVYSAPVFVTFIILLLVLLIGFLFGFFASAILLGKLHPSYHYDPRPDHD